MVKDYNALGNHHHNCINDVKQQPLEAIKRVFTILVDNHPQAMFIVDGARCKLIVRMFTDVA